MTKSTFLNDYYANRELAQANIESTGLNALELFNQLIEKAKAAPNEYNNVWILPEDRDLFGEYKRIAIAEGLFCKWKQRAICINKIAKIAKYAVPLYQALLAEGYKLKVDNSFYDINKAKFDELREQIAGKFNIQIWAIGFSYHYGKFELTIKQSYQHDLIGHDLHNSTIQIEDQFYIYDHEKQKNRDVDIRTTTQNALIKAAKYEKVINDKISELTSQLSAVKGLLYS